MSRTRAQVSATLFSGGAYRSPTIGPSANRAECAGSAGEAIASYTPRLAFAGCIACAKRGKCTSSVSTKIECGAEIRLFANRSYCW